MTAIREIDVNELAELLAGGAELLDVREHDEYLEAHVPGAQLIPLSELQGRTDEVPTADVVYVICRGGARSLKACEALATEGREYVNVAGGTLAWIDTGRPVATGPDRG